MVQAQRNLTIKSISLLASYQNLSICNVGFRHCIITPQVSSYRVLGLSQLIDEENWDDEQSTFIALRQTLLTKMVALAEDRFRLPLASHRQILVDIRDAILGKTGIDLVLMNMVLREFLATQSGRKLIGE
jgi:hypothetical protein